MSDDTRQYILFHLGAEEYALPIARVSSVIRYEPATPVPRAPKGVDGVINLRGRVIPVVDLSRRLVGAACGGSQRARIIIAESAGGLVGLAVDAASEVASAPISSVLPAPAGLMAEYLDAIEGVLHIGDRLVVVLDVDRVLPESGRALVAAETAEGEP